MKTLIFGDSIARWAFDHLWWRVERLKGAYLAWWQENYSHGIYNFSISGATSRGLDKWIDQSCSHFKTIISDQIQIVINIWSNDAMGEETTDPFIAIDEFENNIANAITVAKKYTNTVMILWNVPIDENRTLPWKVGEYTFWMLNENQELYNQKLEAIAISTWCRYISCRDRIDPTTDHDDWVHPNSSWHKKIFTHMKKILDDLI